MSAAELRDHAASDHKRGCQGRCYSCECGYDDKTEPLLMQAAAEIEQLAAALKQAIAYADAVAREDGMPDGKQCKRLAVQEVVLTGRLGGRPVVEFDVAAARALVSALEQYPG